MMIKSIRLTIGTLLLSLCVTPILHAQDTGFSGFLHRAGAVVKAIVEDAPESYEAAWQGITRNYRLLTRALVLASTPRPLRRAIVPAGRLLPSAFGFAVNILAS